MKENTEKLYYGYRFVTYISIGLFGIGAVCVVLAIAFTLLTYSTWVLVLCWALGAILLIAGAFWHISMSPVTNPATLRALEDNFLKQLRTVWDGKGKALDIGTGRGRMAISIASHFPETQVTGVDMWTKMWKAFGQTRAGAEKNAMIAKVSDRCTFQHGNALELPFKDGEFDLVVSVFTFHEVQAPDRTVLLKEVARVLAPGGTFLICDFFMRRYYKVKDTPEFIKKVQQLGVEDVKYTALKEAGLDMGRLYNSWSLAYLSGRKQKS